MTDFSRRQLHCSVLDCSDWPHRSVGNRANQQLVPFARSPTLPVAIASLMFIHGTTPSLDHYPLTGNQPMPTCASWCAVNFLLARALAFIVAYRSVVRYGRAGS